METGTHEKWAKGSEISPGARRFRPVGALQLVLNYTDSSHRWIVGRRTMEIREQEPRSRADYNTERWFGPGGNWTGIEDTRSDDDS